MQLFSYLIDQNRWISIYYQTYIDLTGANSAV